MYTEKEIRQGIDKRDGQENVQGKTMTHMIFCFFKKHDGQNIFQCKSMTDMIFP